jgi:hypothetical protein
MPDIDERLFELRVGDVALQRGQLASRGRTPRVRHRKIYNGKPAVRPAAAAT